MTVTIHDVAKRAGVGSVTVSRVINNSGYASEEVRQRVLEAVKEMGYVPNRLASSLRSKRTNVLALVMTDITNPFFTVAARGVEDVANQAGYTLYEQPQPKPAGSRGAPCKHGAIFKMGAPVRKPDRRKPSFSACRKYV